MKIITLLTFLNLLLIFVSCNGQAKPIGEEPLDLFDFNFDTKVETLFPDQYKSKNYKDYYTVPTHYHSISFEKDSTFIDKFGEHKKAVGIEYRQQSSSNMDTLAIFKNQAFNRINFATNLKNEITVVCAVADEMTAIQSQNFLKMLTEKYGKYKKTEGEFGRKFFMYEWQTKRAVIRYSSVFNDERNTVKIAVTENSMTPADKDPHFEGYFYTIRKDAVENIKNLNTGDFVFID